MLPRTKTLLCVTMAGIIFIAAVLLHIKYLAIAGAFFDWLPLPTGWMRFSTNPNKKAIFLHVLFTIVAYALLITWIFENGIFSLLFLELWWLAVMAGSFI